MKAIIYLIIGVIVLMALGAMLKWAIGVLFWVGLAVVIGGLTVSVIRGWAQERLLNAPPSARQDRRLEREAERALKDIEKQTRES